MKETENTPSWATKTRKLTVNLMVWTFAWVITVAIFTFGPKFLWHGNKTLTILALILNVGMGVGMIVANKVFLRGSDEMQQKIQLDAMAATLGATLVGGIAYATMDTTNLISGDAEIGFLIMFMGLFYMASAIIGRLRYL